MRPFEKVDIWGALSRTWVGKGQEKTGSFKPEGVHCIEGLPECPLLTFISSSIKVC